MRLLVASFHSPDPRRRERLRKILRSYGWETLPDVYECPLSPVQDREFRSRLEAVMGKGDRVRVYQVCRDCITQSWENGGPAWNKRPSAWCFFPKQDDRDSERT